MKIILRSTLTLIICLVLSVSGYAQLQSLSAFGGLTPSFSPTVYSYTRPVGPHTVSVSLTFTLVAGSTLKINGTPVSASYYTLAVNGNNTTYTLEVTAANGEKSTYTIQMPMMSVTLAITKATCNTKNDGAVSAVFNNAIPPYVIRWYDENYNSKGTGTSVSGLAPGNYWCNAILEDGSGSFVSTYFTVGVNNTISTNAVKTNVTCAGAGNGQVTLAPTGGTAPYAYTWSNGGSAATAGNLSPGNYSVTVSDAIGCTQNGTYTITQPTALNVTSFSGDVSCNGGRNGSAGVSVSGGTTPYTYTWSSPVTSTSQVANSLAAGDYTCTIKDKNGCTQVRNFTISEPTAITATAIQTDVSCNGQSDGSIALTASGGMNGYTYTWSPSGGTSAMAKNLSAGDYTCEIKDARGCKINKTYTVAQPAFLTATISKTDATCADRNDGTATVVASGGTAPYTYAWSGLAGTHATATGLFAGDYTCIITDKNGCSISKDITVGSPALLFGTVNSTNVACNGGNTGSAVIVVVGGTQPYTYRWSPSGSTSASAVNLVAGKDTCTVTDKNGCTTTQIITISQPAALTATISATTVSCKGGNNGAATVVASGGTSPYTYTWSGSASTSATANGLAAGDYTCTIKDRNGCTITKTITVPEIQELTATTTTTDVSCNGGNNGSATIDVSGGTAPYSYVWAEPGTIDKTATGLSAKTYSYTVTDAKGCTVTKDVTITQPAALTATVSKTDAGCYGAATGTATISPTGGVAPYTYAWSSGAGANASANNLRANDYSCVVTDKNHCTVTASVTISQPGAPLTATVTKTDAKCNGAADGSATVSASGGTAPYAYQWSQSGATGTTVNGLAKGNYTCTITDKNGCSITETFEITQPTALNVTIAKTDVSCAGGNNGTATVTANGGTPAYTYAWSSGAGTGAAATGLVAGNYTCTITDNNHCEVIKSITVGEPVALIATTAQTNITCAGQRNGTAEVTVSGGTAPYTYAWSSSGGNAARAANLLPQDYSCTITDTKGCTLVKDFTITEPLPLTVAASQVNVSCAGGNNATATVTVSGGTVPYTYAWSSGGSGNTASNLIAGDYSCIITDKNGCTITQDFSITQPTALTATTLQEDVKCYGAATGAATVNASGGTLPYTYTWSASASTDRTATGLVAGTYSCTIKDANLCTLVKDITIVQPAAGLAINVSQTQTSCASQNSNKATAIVSGGTAPYTYAWSAGGNNATTTALAPGDYTISVTDGNGCTADKTITLVENPLPAAQPITGNTTVLVNGTTALSNSVTGGVWTSSNTTVATVNSASGLVTGIAQGATIITYTVSNGICENKITQQVTVNPLPPNTSISSRPASFTNQQTASFSFNSDVSNVSYEASVDGAAFAAVSNPLTISGLTEGSHTLSVRAVDMYGTADPTPGTFTWMVDVTPPLGTISINANAIYTNNPTVALALTGSDNNGTVEAAFSNDGTSYSPYTVFNTAKQWTLASGDGNKRVYMQLRDQAGNTFVTTAAILLDMTAPALPVITQPVNNTSINNTLPVIKGTAEANAIITVYIDGNFVTMVHANAAGNWQYALTQPLSNGNHEIKAKAQDAAGNESAFTNSLNVYVDITDLTLQLSANAPQYINAAFNVTMVFNKAVSNFNQTDLVVTNGAVSNFASVDGKTYTATITPTTDGEVKVNVSANAAQDAAGNGNLASNTLVRNYDATKPTVVVASTSANPLNSTFDITISFNEAVAGFDQTDLGVTNGTVSNFTSVDGKTFTATITPTTDGEVKVNVSANAAQDAAGNGNLASNTFVRNYDATKPTVAISSTSANPLNIAFDITISFSEAIRGFDQTDLVVTNGAVSNFTSVDSKTYRATITPTTDGEVKVNVSAKVAQDAAGNGNLASNTLVRNYDATKPTVVISSVSANPLNKAFDITISFSEAVAGFDQTDLAVTNGTVSNFISVDGKTYTATIMPLTDGEVKVNVTADAAQDAAGNGNLASNTLVGNYDATKPTVTISSTSGNPLNIAFDITISFSEAVNGFDQTDLAVTNGSVSTFISVDGKTYTATITPTIDGEVKVNVTADAAQDAAGNGNTVSNVLVRNYVAVKPAVTINSISAGLINKAFDITVEFSQLVTGFNKADLSVTNGTVSNFLSVDAKKYTATITPVADGEVKVSIAGDVAQDAAGNGNAASGVLIRNYDGTRPVVTVFNAMNSPVNTAPLIFEIAFSENVSGFTEKNITIVNGIVSKLEGSGNKYKIEVMPDASGLVTASVQENEVADAAGNKNTQSNVSSVLYDKVNAVVKVAVPASTTAPYTATISFSKRVAGFMIDKINVVNATLSLFTKVNDSAYTVLVTPVHEGDVKLYIPAGVVNDAAGNVNDQSITATTVARFSAAIDKIYPVPANTFLNIRFKGITKEKMRVLLTDMKGNILRDKEVPLQSDMLTLNVADLPSGVYNMVVQSAGYTYNTKVIVTR